MNQTRTRKLIQHSSFLQSSIIQRSISVSNTIKMKRISFEKYGPPSQVLQLKEDEPIPQPKAGEILVKNYASSINSVDWHVVRPVPFLVRFKFGLFRPTRPFLGADISGIVEAVGENVTDFKKGDAVFGACEVGPNTFGAYAQYVTVESFRVAKKPENVSFLDASCAGVAALTAIHALNDCGIKEGEAEDKHVLVNGASSGVGMFAVQIAKAFGANVTAVCSGSKADMVQKLGATHVVDYTKDDVTKLGKKFDVIVECALYRSASDYKDILNPGGYFGLVGGAVQHFFRLLTYQTLLLNSTTSSKFFIVEIKLKADAVSNYMKKLAKLLADGSIKSFVDKTFTLNEVGTAIEKMEQRKVKGKYVVVIEEEQSEKY